MTKLLTLWVADYHPFSCRRCSVLTGFRCPPACFCHHIGACPPVVPHIVAVAGGAQSSGTSGPSPLAALPFPGPQAAAIGRLTSLELQSTMASSPISLIPSGSGTCFSPGSDPCPHKLMEKVQSGIYVEMKVESLNVVTTPSSPQRHKASAQRSIIIGVKALRLLGLHCSLMPRQRVMRPAYLCAPYHWRGTAPWRAGVAGL